MHDPAPHPDAAADARGSSSQELTAQQRAAQQPAGQQPAGQSMPESRAVDPACAGACSCGAPSRGDFATQPAEGHRFPGIATDARHHIEQVAIPAGSFRMGEATGAENRGDGETPVHTVTLPAFSMDATSVTNADFRAFAEATGYVTDAERWGFSAVFHLAITAPEADWLGRPPRTPWWVGVRGASWRAPGGAGSSVEGLDDHPVVHVSYDDALAYCAWAERRLPTEAEWEYAARGGIDGARYPWGDEAVDDGGWRTNIWQGRFPTHNTLDDGFLATAPVRSFAPNGYGLWQMVGNVWEWCADWYSPNAYSSEPRDDPRGPAQGQVRVLRGGSYLCHDSYCNRYRNAARSQNTADSSMGNAGFRTVSLR